MISVVGAGGVMGMVGSNENGITGLAATRCGRASGAGWRVAGVRLQCPVRIAFVRAEHLQGLKSCRKTSALKACGACCQNEGRVQSVCWLPHVCCR